MKILQLGKFYPIRGGVEKVMWDITVELSRRQIPCDMLCCILPDRQPDWKDTPYQQTQDGMLAFRFSPNNTVICAPARTQIAGTMISVAMIKVLRKISKEYDIIHIHHPDPMACLALRLSGFKGKVVLHWHSDIVSQKWLLKLYEPLQGWLIRRADAVIGTTPVYLEQSPYLKEVPPGKKVVVPIGVPPVPYDKTAVSAFREKHPGKKIVFALGRLVPYKGFSYLVEAATDLPDDYLILIGGTGPDFADLKQQIYSLQVQRKVEVMGFLTDERVRTLFHACDIFVLPSVMKTEAFGIVQIEAMSCSKPVVATRIPESGVSWVNENGKSGINVPCCDAAALAKAIVDICEARTEYSRFCQGANERYQDLFTSESMIKKTLETYEKITQA